MNKTEFINSLADNLTYPLDKCVIINKILESNFINGKKNKEKIVEELVKRLEVTEEEAQNIYDTVITIINDEIKNKLKHPFKSKD